MAYYTEWTAFGACTDTCGTTAYQTRARTCTDLIGTTRDLIECAAGGDSTEQQVAIFLHHVD